jgi:mycofactocin precursor
MADTSTTEQTEEAGQAEETAAPAGDLAGDVLVEEVSIDGMCGVY